ncbi:hypothetical protein AAZX31_05G182900 [Glycine max]
MEIYPLNTQKKKMILGPGFIPPTQLLFSIPFSFFLSIFISFLHALMFVFAGSEFSTHWWQSCFVKAGENYREANFIILLGKKTCHHFHQHLKECTSVLLCSEMTVMSVEGMHSLDAEVADAYTCEREMK